MTAEGRAFSVASVSWVHDCFVAGLWAFEFSCEDAHPAVLLQPATGMSAHRFPAARCKGLSLRATPGFLQPPRRCPSQGRALAEYSTSRMTGYGQDRPVRQSVNPFAQLLILSNGAAAHFFTANTPSPFNSATNPAWRNRFTTSLGTSRPLVSLFGAPV